MADDDHYQVRQPGRRRRQLSDPEPAPDAARVNVMLIAVPGTAGQRFSAKWHEIRSLNLGENWKKMHPGIEAMANPR
ncbi:hypothetical protein PE067_14025 [Paracoccus sp. DMF-8]|uniref:hypothetical protein n=1 Tax=Paracoccus sp. DMF-8 TaxID=3019445 RepID=UPI0023E84697|nr:hypothetical protein [Paracoccus sp. DMF-8]MDF3607153.1 hypothetical protein [Paracoccus sp. DMF-8]